jgi:hypothetical protein
MAGQPVRVVLLPCGNDPGIILQRDTVVPILFLIRDTVDFIVAGFCGPTTGGSDLHEVNFGLPDSFLPLPALKITIPPTHRIRITSRTNNHLYLETNQFSAMIWRFIVNLVALA